MTDLPLRSDPEAVKANACVAATASPIGFTGIDPILGDRDSPNVATAIADGIAASRSLTNAATTADG